MPAHAAWWTYALLHFVNLADYGIHIDFMSFLAIHDFNLVDDAASSFSIIPFNRFAGLCILGGFDRIDHAGRLST